MRNFSEMNDHRFPHYMADGVIKSLSKQLCEADCRQEGFKSSFNKQVSIRHHKMTIALAMPDRLRGKYNV